jgi:hypothetical protein
MAMRLPKAKWPLLIGLALCILLAFAGLAIWKASRDPDDGRGVARIVNKERGLIMNTDLSGLNRLRELEEDVAREKGVNPETLRRMVAKVEEYSESHRAHGLPDDLLNILKDDLELGQRTM